jgi:hypothetical protein
MADDRRHCRACDALSRRAASERDGLCTACAPAFTTSDDAERVRRDREPPAAVYTTHNEWAARIRAMLDRAGVDYHSRPEHAADLTPPEGPSHPNKPGCPNTPECDDYCAGYADGRASVATPPAAETRYAITAGFSLKFCAGCGSQISPTAPVRFIVTGGTFERECCSKVCAHRLLEPSLPKPPADPEPPKAA